MPHSTVSPNRPRSHSAGAAPFEFAYHSTKTDPSSGYVNYNTLSAMSTQPLIHLLSMETESRRYKQEMEQESDHSHQQPCSVSIDENLLDALLPMDDIVPVTNINTTVNDNPGRATRLKFELPTGGPTHAKSPLHPNLCHQLVSPADHSSDLLSSSPPPPSSSKNNHKKRMNHMKKHRLTRRSKWGLGSTSGITSSSDYSEDEDELGVTITTAATSNATLITPMIGAKVELRRRPLPTFGTIQYVGPVSFAKGTWIGLELESRRKCFNSHGLCLSPSHSYLVCVVGKNNGCVSGVTYFHTAPQRGLFVKQDDFTIISIPTMAH